MESLPARRSKRLRGNALPFQCSGKVDQTSSTPPPFEKPTIQSAMHTQSVALTKLWAQSTATFPLSSFLQFDHIITEHLLPHLSPDDLCSLEMVDKGSRAAFRSKSFWKLALRSLLKSDKMAAKILRKRLSHPSPYLRDMHSDAPQRCTLGIMTTDAIEI